MTCVKKHFFKDICFTKAGPPRLVDRVIILNLVLMQGLSFIIRKIGGSLSILLLVKDVRSELLVIELAI